MAPTASTQQPAAFVITNHGQGGPHTRSLPARAATHWARIFGLCQPLADAFWMVHMPTRQLGDGLARRHLSKANNTLSAIRARRVQSRQRRYQPGGS